MKRSILIMAVVLNLYLSSTAHAIPVYIQVDAFGMNNFQDMFLNGVCTLVNDPNEPVDYVFGINQQGQVGSTIFNVTPNNRLVIEEGTTIVFWTNVSLVNMGEITGAEGARIISDPAQQGGRWGSVVIKAMGQAVFTGFTFDFGGSGQGDAVNWPALITLTNRPAEDGLASAPSLTLQEECWLTNSSTNGILVHEDGEAWGYEPFVSLDNTMLRPLILNQQLNVLGCGILFEAGIPHAPSVAVLEAVNGTEILECGQHGISHLGFPGGPAAVRMLITDSQISSCGWDGLSVNGSNAMLCDYALTISNSNVTENGSPAQQGFGWGVNLYDMPNTATVINIIEGCLVSQNSWGGIRIWHSTPQAFIRDSEISSNGLAANEGPENGLDQFLFGAGIRTRLLSYHICPVNFLPLLVIENCLIQLNGHEGICASLEYGDGVDGAETGTNIVGNHIVNNAQQIQGGQDMDDPMEGAGIHLLDHIYRANILNNTIENGISGICFDAIENAPPMHARVRNNIQSGARFGMYLWRQNSNILPAPLEPNEPPNPGYSNHFYNNVFWNNTTAGVFVGNNPLNAMFVEQIQSNLIGNSVIPNGSFAFIYQAGAVPQFGFNAIWQNQGGNGFNPPGSTVQLNPMLVDGFHLYWNSPLINRGVTPDPNDARLVVAFAAPWSSVDPPMLTANEDDPNEDRLRDGSRNDIGAYGGRVAYGVDANIMLDPPAGIDEPESYGFDPYCKIDAQNSIISNAGLPAVGQGQGGRASLEDDYYRIFANCEVPLNGGVGELDVDAGVFFECLENVKFKVSGILETHGVQNNCVRFTGYQRNEDPDAINLWTGIYFQNTAILRGALDWTEVSDAWIGVYFGNIRPGAGRITIRNCDIFDCDMRGIDIYNSKVEISGNVPQGNQDDRGSFTSSIEMIGHVNQLPALHEGLAIGYCSRIGGLQDVIVTDTWIQDCGAQNEASIFECGVDAYTTDAQFTNVMVRENATTGMVISTCDNDLQIVGNEDRANDFRHNGQDLANQGGAFGAEIHMSQFSQPRILWADIQDDEQPNADFHYLIYSMNPPPGGVTLENCWFDNNNPPDNWFFPEDPWVYNILNPQAQEIDDRDPYREAITLLDSGRVAEARDIFESLIESYPDSSVAITSTRYLLKCCQTLDEGYDALRDQYRRLLRNRDESPLAEECKLLIPRSHLAESNYEAALRAFSDLRNEEQPERVRVRAEIGYLDLARAMDRDDLDEASSPQKFHATMSDLRLRLNSLDEGRFASKNVPGTFGLVGAYPNPFNGLAKIQYDVAEVSAVKLAVYDLEGRLVELLVDSQREPGSYSIVWNASSVASGTYLIRMETPNGTWTAKSTLIR